MYLLRRRKAHIDYRSHHNVKLTIIINGILLHNSSVLMIALGTISITSSKEIQLVDT